MYFTVCCHPHIPTTIHHFHSRFPVITISSSCRSHTHVAHLMSPCTCVVPRTHAGFGDRAFQVAGLWMRKQHALTTYSVLSFCTAVVFSFCLLVGREFNVLIHWSTPVSFSSKSLHVATASKHSTSWRISDFVRWQGLFTNAWNMPFPSRLDYSSSVAHVQPTAISLPVGIPAWVFRSYSRLQPRTKTWSYHCVSRTHWFRVTPSRFGATQIRAQDEAFENIRLSAQF